MNDPLTVKTVEDFVLESEANIEIAAHVTRSFPDIQRKIVMPVLDALEQKLRKALGASWDIYNCRDEVLVKRWAGFSVSRKSWGEIYISFESGDWGDFATIGVWRDRNKPRFAAADAPVTEAFREKKLAGESQRYWAWYQRVPDGKGNWNAAPALAAMHFRPAEIVEYMAKQILAVHKIAAPVIDRVLGKKRRDAAFRSTA